MKKLTTTKLLGLLVILLLVYAGTEFFSNTGRSRSFREELVSINLESVSKIIFTKQGKQTLLNLEDQGWQVSQNEGKVYKAQEDKIKNMLSTLQSIKPSRIASRNSEKWNEFQVDSTGMRAEIFEGNKKVLDIVLGRFGMQNQQQFYSYVRLFDEDNVYVADNFMGFSISNDPSSYRNQTVTSFSKDSVNVVRFNYPGDSSFSIEKSISGRWISNEITPDSAKTVQFISSLSRLNSTKFENNTNISGLDPRYTTLIEISGKEPIELNAFAKNDSSFIITSSINQDGQFQDPSLFEKIFRGKSSFNSEDSINSSE